MIGLNITIPLKVNNVHIFLHNSSNNSINKVSLNNPAFSWLYGLVVCVFNSVAVNIYSQCTALLQCCMSIPSNQVLHLFSIDTITPE